MHPTQTNKYQILIEEYEVENAEITTSTSLYKTVIFDN